MGPFKIKEFVLGVLGTIVFLGVVVFTQANLCDDSPASAPDDETAKVFSVTFRNEASQNIHIVGPGETPGDANRLLPGGSRTWTTPAPGKKVGDSLVFGAFRLGFEIDHCTLIVSRAVRDQNPRAQAVFSQSGGEEFLNCL